MKLSTRLFALLLSVLMVISSVSIMAWAEEYEFKFEKIDGFGLEGGNVPYEKFNLTSKVNGNTVAATALTFDPAQGYIPMAFSGYSGTSAVLSKQYQIATDKYGYDVVGVINGSFFTMDNPAYQNGIEYGNYGTLNSYVVSNGKIATAHAGDSGEMVVFGSDGSMKVVNSKLDYKLYIKGEEMTNGIYYINKTSGSKVASRWNGGFYYYDTSCGSVADTYEICPGYEVYCKKLDNTDLVIGGTLKGEVIEVKSNAYGGSLADNAMDMSDKFILFVKTDSPNAAYVSGLQAGDSISITCNETVAGSKEIMENANSVIANVGWLVKDGVDQTQIQTTIGSHNVTLQARWTAFGTKDDGSYVFFTTEGASTGEGGSVTLQDVAKAMMDMGCTNVIRMDGGGSSAMYLCDAGSGTPGYVQSSTRAVGDCILVVARDGVQDSDLDSALDVAIAAAEEALAGGDNAVLQAALDEAKALKTSGTAVSGDVRKAIMNINAAMSGKTELSDLVAAVAGIDYNEYSSYVLDNLRAAYSKAVSVLGSDSATLEDVVAAKTELDRWYKSKGSTEICLTTNKKYTSSKLTRNDTFNDDLIRLTDGTKGSVDGGTAAYAGWDIRYTGTQNAEVIVDLEQNTKGISRFKAYLATCNDWGIGLPTGMEAYVSNNGKNFSKVGATTELVTTSAEDGVWVTHEFEIKLDETASGRYIKFVFNAYSHVWVDEVEAYATYETVTDAIYVTGFNKGVGNEDCIVFTSAMGDLLASGANLNWTRNIVAKWDEELGEYVITETWQGGGSTASRTLAEDEVILAVHYYADPDALNNKNLAAKAKVGQILKLNGIDPKTGYFGPGAYASYEDAPPKYDKGDVNCDEKINATDYIMLKRAILGTYELSEDGEQVADINGDEKVNATDYIMLKRVILGTYEL